MYLFVKNLEEAEKNPVSVLKRWFVLDFINKVSGKKDDKKKKKEGKKRQYLPLYCRDLTERARKGELGKIIGRDREFARLVEILCRQQKNNPCLIGEPGVGKTAIAEALAQRIVSGDVPYKLKNKEVHLVDLTAIVAGTQFRGQFESRIKGLIDEVRSPCLSWNRPVGGLSPAALQPG